LFNGNIGVLAYITPAASYGLFNQFYRSFLLMPRHSLLAIALVETIFNDI